MATVEEHLREIVGSVVAQLMVQTALARADADAQREKLQHPTPNTDGRVEVR